MSTLRFALMTPLLASALGFAGLAAAPAPAAGQNKEIDTLIAQLSSPDPAARQQAQEKLSAMGDAARPALEQQIRARSAAEEMLTRIENSKVAGPTLVSLNVTAFSPTAALQELCEQTGYEVQLMGGAGRANLPNVNVAMEKKPFWTVMRDVCVQSGLSFYNAGMPDRRLSLTVAGPGQSSMDHPCCVSGAFLAMVTSVQRSSAVDMSNPQTISRSLSVQLQIMVEPKVRVTRYSQTIELDEAVDDKGRSLIVNNPGRFFGGGFFQGRTMSWPVSVPLQAPAGASKIDRLKGKLRLTVQTRSEVMEFTDVLNAKDVARTAGGRRAVLKEVKKLNNQQYQAHLVVYRDNLPQDQFHEMMNSNAIKLLNDLGQEYQHNGSSSSGGGDQFDMTLTFQQRPRDDGGGGAWEGDPTTLRWEIPTATREITVPLEFTNLPM